MQMIPMRKTLCLALSAAVLAGCATQPTGPSTRPGTASSRPQQPANPTPNADWHNLGVSPNGNILNEIDALSVRRSGTLVTFRDRKTIFNTRKENFLTTPRHKYSINTWQVDCRARTYRLLDVTLYDENSRQVASFSYNDSQIKPMPVVQNSASFQQMQFVCQGSQPL